MNETVEPQPRPVSYTLPLSRPRFTWILLGLIVAVYLGMEAMGWTLTGTLGGSSNTEVLIRMGAKVTPLIAAGEYWRLFTSMFLHIGIMHLAFNGYALLVIGTELERLFGHSRFLAIYFLSGLMGSLASYAFSYSLAAGASGAIFGLIGALGAFFAIHRERLGTWGRNRLINIAFLIALNLFLGFTQPGIDNLAHIGGLLAGLGLGWAMTPHYKLDPVRMQVVDRNQLSRYWPALALAVAILVSGTALATVVHRDSPRSQLLRGQEAIEAEAWDEAASELEGALSRDPTLADVPTLFYLGLAYNYLEQPQEAAKAYEAALELDPSHSPSIWNLALTYLDVERYVEARPLFERYQELNPAETLQVRPYLDELKRLGY
ncbi:MAG: rhomboid family intramembrane serine protease [Anaerolineae bacterium]